MFVEIEPYLKRLEKLLKGAEELTQALLYARHPNLMIDKHCQEAMARHEAIKSCVNEIKAQMKEDSAKQIEHQWWEPSVPENWRKQVPQKKGIKSLFVWKV